MVHWRDRRRAVLSKGIMGNSNAKATLISGLAAGAAFALVLEADLRLTGNNVDDMLVLGRPFVADRTKARRVGIAIHFVNSVGLAALYGEARQWFPGPPWLKGVLFANVENALLYPITILEELHPGIRDGEIDRYFTWPSFWQSIPRHVAYGAVLGIL
jgi:hypothetical protein